MPPGSSAAQMRAAGREGRCGAGRPVREVARRSRPPAPHSDRRRTDRCMGSFVGRNQVTPCGVGRLLWRTCELLMLVAALDRSVGFPGSQGVRGSNPLSSTLAVSGESSASSRQQPRALLGARRGLRRFRESSRQSLQNRMKLDFCMTASDGRVCRVWSKSGARRPAGRNVVNGCSRLPGTSGTVGRG